MSDEKHDYADGMLAYNRFVQPALEQALAHVDRQLATDGHTRILDAGCGPGGAFPLFFETFGEDTTVVAVDNSEPHLEAARERVRRLELEETVSLERCDLADGLSTGREPFDVLWFSNVLFFFDDPIATLSSFTELLRPGGVVAVFYGGWDRAAFLPGNPHLEALVYQARMAGLDRCPSDWRDREGTAHPERAPKWLTAAGFESVRHDVLPVTYRRDARGDLDEGVRQYLEQRFSEIVDDSMLEHGRSLGLSEADIEQILALLDPERDTYVLDQPGYLCHIPTLLTTGVSSR